MFNKRRVKEHESAVDEVVLRLLHNTTAAAVKINKRDQMKARNTLNKRKLQTRLRGYKTFFMFSSAEYEFSPANKSRSTNK